MSGCSCRPCSILLRGENSAVNCLNKPCPNPENKLTVNQEAATNSLVAGSPRDDFGLSLTPEETGSFVVYGDILPAPTGTVVATINQGSAATQFGSGNSASVTLGGNGGFAGLEQIGDSNSATIDVRSDNAGGIIIQSGNDNKGRVSVEGAGAFGELIQIGDGNDNGLVVSGNPNASVSFTTEGNNSNTNIPANVVTSSGGQITIVQRQLGSFN